MINYRPGFIPNKIVIIGCGGTGSRLVPLLAQFIKTCSWIQNPEITLVDNDVVEEKNLQRQNFIAADVGKPKALVLANRYSKAFNVPINPYVMKITQTDGEELARELEQGLNVREATKSLFQANRTNVIYILCVDSVKARQEIVHYVFDWTSGNGFNALLIDSGNENDFGQVSVSTAAYPDCTYYTGLLQSYPQALPGDMEVPGIPLDVQYFTNMKVTGGASCADLDQTMAINTMMAVTIFGVIQQFYYAKPISFHRINVTLANGATPEYITPKFLMDAYSHGHTYKNGNAGSAATNIGSGPRAVDYTRAIKLFDDKIYEPFRKLTEKAQAQIDSERLKKETKELEKLKDKYIREAMLKYGWEIPAERKAAFTSLANCLAAVVQEKISPSPEALEKKAQNEAKKQAVKKKTKSKDATDYGSLLREVLDTYVRNDRNYEDDFLEKNLIAAWSTL